MEDIVNTWITAEDVERVTRKRDRPAAAALVAASRGGWQDRAARALVDPEGLHPSELTVGKWSKMSSLYGLVVRADLVLCQAPTGPLGGKRYYALSHREAQHAAKLRDARAQEAPTADAC